MLKSKSPGVRITTDAITEDIYQRIQETIQNIRIYTKGGNTMRILIYGAGVIGSFYASRFAKAGLDVTILARGQRLKELQEHGLMVQRKNKNA